jgi:amino acid permease
VTVLHRNGTECCGRGYFKFFRVKESTIALNNNIASTATMTSFEEADPFWSRDQADITTPLLRKSPDSTSSSSSLAPSQTTPLHRTLEDDVLPETAVVGRTLHWSSAFIIIISRVIGSGIFATPGAITSSVGSIGLSLSLWVVGAAISWCGLAVGLEYGCMLPRSGGKFPPLHAKKPQ